MFAKLEHHWHAFKQDEPGKRFVHQHERMQKEGRGLFVAMLALGIALLVGGVILLFIPGPGLLLIVFGLALVAGVSETLAKLLDRAEPPLRRVAARAQAWWKRASWPARLAVVIPALAVAAGATWFVIRRWF